MTEYDKYMARALQLAAMGDGKVSPNPMVGAVIVCNNKVIGEGYHVAYGRAHAEVNAVNSVKSPELLKESTLYVTLEPCAHYGKTPPCSELIIRKGIPKVVIGCLDPFEKVGGKGAQMLKKAGIEVVTGVMERQCIELNRKFITAHRKKRPYILLKWAQSADGLIDHERTDRGAQAIISNPVTTMWTHRERSRYDAIMVGSNTVLKDNPSLSVREWPGKNPVRIVLDRDGDTIPTDSKILTDGGKTLVFSYNTEGIAGHVEYIKLNSHTDILEHILKELYRRNIISVMIEGGAVLLQKFIDKNLWDEARIEYGSCYLHSGVKAPSIDGITLCIEKHGVNRIETLIRS